MEDKIIRLKKLVESTYRPYKCGWTAERSRGNFDDCFDDGFESGQSWLSYKIGEILDMTLEKPEEQKYDF